MVRWASGAQAGEEFGRQDHAREESERPDQGRQGTRRHQHVGHAPQAQPARELGDHRADGRRRRLGLADDRGKAANADGMGQARAAGATDPDRGEDGGERPRLVAGRLGGPIPDAGSGLPAAIAPREFVTATGAVVAPRRVRASSRSFSAGRRSPRAAPGGKRMEALR